MVRIPFKYHPNVWELGVFKHSRSKTNPPKCECCGTPTEYYLNYIYADEEPSCICPSCVASGQAADKYNGCFIAESEYSKIIGEEKAQELLYCTPGYSSWKGEHWLACCEDYCAFIGYVGKEDLEELGIGEEAFSRGFKSFRDVLSRHGAYRGYLFKCLHCNAYHVWVDFD